MSTRWLFGDQLAPCVADDHRGPLLMVESLGVLKRTRSASPSTGGCTTSGG